MKIALCLSGQPRGLKLAIAYMKKGIIIPNNITDIFLHAWHDESKVGQMYNSAQPHRNSDDAWAWLTGYIQPKTADILLEEYKPKLSIIEPQKEFPHLRSLNAVPEANQEIMGSLFYSIYMANELKKEYEKKNGFKYDMVIRSRHDMWFEREIHLESLANNLDKIMVSAAFQNPQEEQNSPTKPMQDIFAIGNSENMDIFCGVYLHMEEINKHLNPPYGERYLGYWVRVANDVPLQTMPWNYNILGRVHDLRSC
jgi:hypothetical protein